MRRRRPVKREQLQDPKYGSKLVSKFISCMMFQGKKGGSETIFYKAMDILQKKTQKDPVEVFVQALENTKPLVEVKSRRVGGATYQVPVAIRPGRRHGLCGRGVTPH